MFPGISTHFWRVVILLEIPDQITAWDTIIGSRATTAFSDSESRVTALNPHQAFLINDLPFSFLSRCHIYTWNVHISFSLGKRRGGEWKGKLEDQIGYNHGKCFQLLHPSEKVSSWHWAHHLLVVHIPMCCKTPLLNLRDLLHSV